jgi:hypothetical protein
MWAVFATFLAVCNVPHKFLTIGPFLTKSSQIWGIFFTKPLAIPIAARYTGIVRLELRKAGKLIPGRSKGSPTPYDIGYSGA